MSVIMGGSGSTGSSLVKNILNRHEDVFAGGETAFFAKRLIYDKWDKAKKKVTNRKLKGLKNFGFHRYNGTDLDQPEYLYTLPEIEDALLQSTSLHEFTNQFYSKALALNNARIWIEKTPANSSCFNLFLNAYDEGKVIHMVRNPYDTIASLWARGFDLYYAVGIYLLNTASGLSAQKSKDRYHEVKYEEVVSKPDVAISAICSFLNIYFNPKMLVSQGEKIANSKLEGWKYDETANIGKGAVGRFRSLPEHKQAEIIEAVNLISVSERGLDYYELEHMNVKQLCDTLGYEFYDVGSKKSINVLRFQRRKDRIFRFKRGYPTGLYYPLVIQ